MMSFVAESLHGGRAGAQPARYDLQWIAVSFHGFVHGLKCSFAIKFLSDKRFKYLRFAVNGSPEVMGISIDGHEHLIEMSSPLR
jgi:hypothetical protein